MKPKQVDHERTLKLFARFQAIFGHKWTSQVPDDSMMRLAVEEWKPVIAAMRDEQITHAIDQAKMKYDWPPSVAEFIRLAYGIPALDDAMTKPLGELGKLGEELWSRMDRYQYRMMNAKEARAYLRSLYQPAVDKIISEAREDALKITDDSRDRRDLRIG